MSTKMIVLKSNDGFTFEIEEAAARRSQVIARMIEDDCYKDIPIQNVNGKILALVTEYCKKHPFVPDAKPTSVDDANPTSVDDTNPSSVADANPTSKEDLKKWDEEFMQIDDQSTIFDLILAANYLDIKSLLDLACQAVADMIKDKSTDQIRTDFNINGDYTPAEENDIIEKNKWAFE